MVHPGVAIAWVIDGHCLVDFVMLQEEEEKHRVHVVKLTEKFISEALLRFCRKPGLACLGHIVQIPFNSCERASCIPKHVVIPVNVIVEIFSL